MSYQSKYTGAQLDEAVGKALAGGGGHTITIVGPAKKVCYADGTVESNPSGRTFNNIIAIEFTIEASTVSNVIVTMPLGLYCTYSNYAYSDLKYGRITVETSSVQVMYFPFVSGKMSAVASGGS